VRSRVPVSPGYRASNLGLVIYTYVPLSPSSRIWYRPNDWGVTDTPCDALAPYPWSRGVSWYLAECYGNKRSAPQRGLWALGQLYFYVCFLVLTSVLNMLNLFHFANVMTVRQPSKCGQRWRLLLQYYCVFVVASPVQTVAARPSWHYYETANST